MGYSAVFVLVLFPLMVSAGENLCAGTENCTALAGVMDGSRCYFVLKQKANWYDSWTACAAQGGDLAQIQTSSEGGKIMQMVMKQFKNAATTVFMAMQRDNTVLGKPCALTNDTTYWYDNSTAPNLQLKAGSTWIRGTCNAYDAGGEYCMAPVISSSNVILNDVPCKSYVAYPLCQMTVTSENYTQDSVCMNETAIEEFPAKSPQECADACWPTNWCRSFNYIRDLLDTTKQSCQLFSWASDESCPQCPNTYAAPASGECVHYNYQP